MNWAAVATYPSEQLHQEIAYIAYHFHWPLDQIAGLEHIDRRRWVEQVSRLNEQLSQEASRA